MLRLNPLIGFGVPRAAAAYTANAVRFDGSDYITRGADLTGAVDGKQILVSLWAKFFVDSSLLRFCTTTTTTGSDSNPAMRLRIFRTATNQFNFWGDRDNGNTVLELKSSANVLQIADGWVHCMASCDLADTGKRHMYINDTSDFEVVTYDNIDVDLASGGDFSVGAKAGGGEAIDAELADFYLAFTYLDLSIESNRRKFIDASGKPVDLGSDGTLSGAPAPIAYCSKRDGESAADFATNKGTGGAFTLTGTLADAASSPSD